MTQLDTLTLRVMDPVAQARFYTDVLGMSDLGDGRIGYGDGQMGLRFLKAAQPYAPAKSDLYWKIALSVPDIGLAYEQLQAAGVDCSAPRQFRDVGFLASFQDPEGFSVELLDHHFQGARPADWPVDPDQLGGGAHLSLLTLRCADIAALETQIHATGMIALSVQPVTPFGFTLYFYGRPDDPPPNADLHAIENRPWTYQRPYTVLEVQHVHELGAVTLSGNTAAGYGGATLCGTDGQAIPDLGCEPAS